MARNMIDLYLSKSKRWRSGVYTPIDEDAEKQKSVLSVINLLMAETDNDKGIHYCNVAKDEAEKMNLHTAMEMYKKAERIESGD